MGVPAQSLQTEAQPKGLGFDSCFREVSGRYDLRGLRIALHGAVIQNLLALGCQLAIRAGTKGRV